MAQARSAHAINGGGQNSVHNLWYRPRTRLVRGIYCSKRVNASWKTKHVHNCVRYIIHTSSCYVNTIVQQQDTAPYLLRQQSELRFCHYFNMFLLKTNAVNIFILFHEQSKVTLKSFSLENKV